jgi:hypothetical protein
MVFEHGIEDIGALKRELGKHQQGMLYSLEKATLWLTFHSQPGFPKGTAGNRRHRHCRRYG